MTATRATDWQPGDPIYLRAPYRDYLFNFRPDGYNVFPNGDAASWPTPKAGDDLGDHDEIAEAARRLRAAGEIQ